MFGVQFVLSLALLTSNDKSERDTREAPEPPCKRFRKTVSGKKSRTQRKRAERKRREMVKKRKEDRVPEEINERREAERQEAMDLTFGVRCYRALKNKLKMPTPSSMMQNVMFIELLCGNAIMEKLEELHKRWRLPKIMRRLNRQWLNRRGDYAKEPLGALNIQLCNYGSNGFGNNFYLGTCTACLLPMPAERGCIDCIRSSRNMCSPTSTELALACTKTWHREQFLHSICLPSQENATMPDFQVVGEYWDREDNPQYEEEEDMLYDYDSLNEEDEPLLYG